MRSRAATIDRLREFTDAAGVLTEPAAQQRYLIDERQQYHGCALAILRPASTAELSRMMGLCHAENVGMVPQGGNTGYCGGATPDESGSQVVLSLERMNRVRAVDVTGATMTVDAGVVLADAQAAAAARALLLPLSMGSEGSCQIGGNLSTNAGGLTVLRYGTARDLVLGLEVVLPDGRVWDGLRALRKDNTGYDLRQWFIGAEGTLGVISAAVLKLYPQPSARETAWIAVADLAGACELLGRVRSAVGDEVCSFEYVSRASLDLVLKHIDGTRDPLRGSHSCYVLVEAAGGGAGAALRDGLLAALESASADGLVLDAVLAESAAQRTALWRLRESIPAAEKREGGSIKHDVSVAIPRLPALAEESTRRVSALDPAARFSIYGHIGDGNLHFNVLAPTAAAAVSFKATRGGEVSRHVHEAAHVLDGSFSAEHGVGKLKRELLAETAGELALELMRNIKRALDPKGVMNPGKVL